MSEDNILLPVETFADLDQQYEMILERINRFTKNASTSKIPKQTMSLFFKELKEYISIVEQEIKRIEKKIKKAENTKDKTISGILTLNLSKMTIIKQNLKSIIDRFDTGRIFDDEIIYKHNYHSIEQIKETEYMVKQMHDLIKEHKKWNETLLRIELDDQVEETVEKSDNFLVREYELLLAINNMRTVIHNANIRIDELCQKKFHRFKRFYQNSLPQDSYILATVEVKKTVLYKDYQSWKRGYKLFITQMKSIKKIIDMIDQLREYSFPFLKDIFQQTKKILQKKTMKMILSGLKQLDNTYRLSYLIDTCKLLTISPFENLNAEVISNPYDSTHITNLFHAYEQYQSLLSLAHFDMPRGLGDISDIVVEYINNYAQGVYNHAQKMVEAFNHHKKYKYNKSILQSERDEIVSIIKLHQTALNKKKTIQEIIQKITENVPHYTRAFENDTINNIIRSSYTHREEIQNGLIPSKHFVQKDNVFLSMTAYTKYISDTLTKVRRYNKQYNKLLEHLRELHSSLENIKNYTYVPYETLQKAQKRVITITSKSVKRKTVIQSLYHKLQSKYDLMYRTYWSSHHTSSSSYRRKSTSNWGGRSSGGGGGSSGGLPRSSAGGGSFSGGFVSSGGTSR